MVVLPNAPDRCARPAEAGKPTRQAPDYHLNNVNAYHGRLKEWLRRFHGVATKKPAELPGWRRALEALGDNATPATMILGAIDRGPTNNERYKSLSFDLPRLDESGDEVPVIFVRAGTHAELFRMTGKRTPGSWHYHLVKAEFEEFVWRDAGQVHFSGQRPELEAEAFP